METGLWRHGRWTRLDVDHYIKLQKTYISMLKWHIFDLGLKLPWTSFDALIYNLVDSDIDKRISFDFPSI